MNWLSNILDALATGEPWGYRVGLAPAAEPTALVALALAGHGRHSAAEPLRAWLASQQNGDGSVGVLADQSSPGWATALAMFAWRAAPVDAPGAVADPRYEAALERAAAWLLSFAGNAPQQAEYTGHDATLVGWPWVEGTHSWIEPTALNVLALKSVGLAQHDRARQGVQLLVDRLLSSGGCNYGNTVVLGQELRPHVQPTGLAMSALAGEADASGRIGLSLDYLESSLTPNITSSSLAYAMFGLTAHGRDTKRFHSLLAPAADRTWRRAAATPRLALVALAALGADCPLVTLTTRTNKPTFE